MYVYVSVSYRQIIMHHLFHAYVLQMSWFSFHFAIKLRQHIRYSPDATSHSHASAREQALEVVRVYALLISSVHLLYFGVHTPLSCEYSAQSYSRVNAYSVTECQLDAFPLNFLYLLSSKSLASH